MLRFCEVIQAFSFLTSKYNFNKVKHLILSNVVFYPCKYINEKFNPKLISAGLVAVGVAVGQVYLRV
jgi:hypothetical protein